LLLEIKIAPSETDGAKGLKSKFVSGDIVLCMMQFNLSARTIADLAESEKTRSAHLAEALHLRSPEVEDRVAHVNEIVLCWYQVYSLRCYQNRLGRLELGIDGSDPKRHIQTQSVLDVHVIDRFCHYWNLPHARRPELSCLASEILETCGAL